MISKEYRHFGRNFMSDTSAKTNSSATESAPIKRPSRYGRVVITAAIALVLYGLLFYFALYSPLKKAGAFSHLTTDYLALNRFLEKHSIPRLNYNAYFFGGLALSAALYLYTILRIGIRRRVAYLAFAFLFGIHLLYVLQPTALLRTVVFFTLLAEFLRLKNVWLKYILSAIVIGAYAYLVTPTILALIPIYLLARLWQRHDIAAIRLTVLLLLVFCLLYQAGYCSNVFELHPEVSSSATYRRLFPDENYPGHVSYYLLDTLLTLVRILFPVEVFVRMKPLLWIFGAAGVGTTVFLFLQLRRLLSVDWKKPVRHEDRIRADFLTVLLAYPVSLCFTAAEPAEVLRMLSAAYPMLLYLAFAADNSYCYPVLDRDLTDSCPVVFFHTGRDESLPQVLQQAGRACGFRNVVLLGDESNRGLVSNWYDASALTSDELIEFRKIYRHYGKPSDEAFCRLCFEKHFALYAFMKAKHVERCFLCDSDVLLYENLSELPMDDTDFACTGTASSEFLKEHVSPHCVYWTDRQLRRFLSFVLHVYRSNTRWLEDVSLRMENAENPSTLSSSVTDDVLLTAWCKLTTEYNRDFRYRNLCEVLDGSVWDYSLSSPDNLTTGEYLFDKLRGCKQLAFRDRKPYFTRTEDSSAVSATVLHCQNRRRYIPLLVRRISSAPVWLLTRLMFGE